MRCAMCEEGEVCEGVVKKAWHVCEEGKERKHSLSVAHTLSFSAAENRSVGGAGGSFLGTAFTVACFFPVGRWTLLAEEGRTTSPLATGGVAPDGKF